MQLDAGSESTLRLAQVTFNYRQTDRHTNTTLFCTTTSYVVGKFHVQDMDYFPVLFQVQSGRMGGQTDRKLCKGAQCANCKGRLKSYFILIDFIRVYCHAQQSEGASHIHDSYPCTLQTRLPYLVERAQQSQFVHQHSNILVFCLTYGPKVECEDTITSSVITV